MSKQENHKSVRSLISHDGRAILELCRKDAIDISVAEAELIASTMRALFKKGGDGMLRFSSHPEENIDKETKRKQG